jgi:DNA mismatch repair protein MutS2
MIASLERIEYSDLLERVAALASSSAGVREVMALSPATSREEVSRLRAETEACAELAEKGIAPPTASLDTTVAATAKLTAGAIVLDPAELRTVGDSLSEWRCFSRSVLDEEGALPEALSGFITRLPDCAALSTELLRITLPDGSLSPKASRELARLSSKVDLHRRKLSGKLSKMATDLHTRGYLRDAPPTLRNGRFVLPVISSKKKLVSGIVHDRSESGETVFIEPLALTSDGNALQEAILDLEQEERRILREATSAVRDRLTDILCGIDSVGELDAIFARAVYHLDHGTIFPEEGRLNLPALKHPLIPADEAVENDIDLPEDWKVLLVSGPNAGGKSVLLKAIGLAVASSQSGLGAVTSPGATLPHFQRILVSMGDQQSIADHLSTYSARLGEQLAMLRELSDEGLALIDEPAAGTDPVTGAALAVALLEVLSGNGVRLVISTHLGQLKNLATDRSGYYNGSMSFDEHTLQPDYRFVLGFPGSSFTLEIARRMEFPDELLSRAMEMSGDSFRLDGLMAELSAMRDTKKKEIEKLHEEREMSTREKTESMQKLAAAERELARKSREFEEERSRILFGIESEADSLMSRMSLSESEERTEVRREIRELAEGSAASIRREPEQVSETGEPVFSEGDWVTVSDWSGIGMIESIRKDRAIVVYGNLRLERSLGDLLASAPPRASTSDATWGFHEESPEIHLRGLTLDEAIAELDVKIDNCLMAGLHSLRIVHGKGKGILMRGVIDYLRSDGRIRSWRQGEPSEGGTGATVALLKEIGEEK